MKQVEYKLDGNPRSIAEALGKIKPALRANERPLDAVLDRARRDAAQDQRDADFGRWLESASLEQINARWPEVQAYLARQETRLRAERRATNQQLKERSA